MKNVVNDSLAIIREGLIQAASHLIVDASPEGRTSLAAAVTTELNRELKTRGVGIGSLEITELCTWPSGHSISTEAN
jgi:hypothetical protein